MCWREISILDESCDLIKVEGGINQALDFNGIYIANKYTEGKYFKLGSDGYFTLNRFFSDEKESWGFKRTFQNYEYISAEVGKYTISANPFLNGYGGGLEVSCIELSDIQDQVVETQTVTSSPTAIGQSKDLSESIKEKTKRTKDLSLFPEKGSKISFAPDIEAPKITSSSIDGALYTDTSREIKITWEELKNVDGYRVEIFREEKGSYASGSYFTEKPEMAYSPEGGNYFLKVNGVRLTEEGQEYGYESRPCKFTKLYPGNCPEKNITIHFENYENNHVYVKIGGVWYGTGEKYGEPSTMVTFPCPVTAEEFDYEGDPNHIIVSLGRDRTRILKSINLEKQREKVSEDIKELYSKQLINQSTLISSRYRFP